MTRVVNSFGFLLLSVILNVCLADDLDIVLEPISMIPTADACGDGCDILHMKVTSVGTVSDPCTDVRCSGSFDAELVQDEEVSVGWSAGDGFEFAFGAPYRLRFQFQGIDDTCPGEFQEISQQGNSTLQVGQCDNCASCEIFANYEVSSEVDDLNTNLVEVMGSMMETISGGDRTYNWSQKTSAWIKIEAASFMILVETPTGPPGPAGPELYLEMEPVSGVLGLNECGFNCDILQMRVTSTGYVNAACEDDDCDGFFYDSLSSGTLVETTWTAGEGYDFYFAAPYDVTFEFLATDALCPGQSESLADENAFISVGQGDRDTACMIQSRYTAVGAVDWQTHSVSFGMDISESILAEERMFEWTSSDQVWVKIKASSFQIVESDSTKPTPRTDSAFRLSKTNTLV